MNNKLNLRFLTMKWNDLHLRLRVESITDDNVESNCSITRKIFLQKE